MDLVNSNSNHFEIFIFFIFCFLFSFSMFAWGNLIFKNSSIKFISIKIVTGMAMTLFFGGFLNFFELANKFLINSIFVLGLLIYLIEAFRENYFLKLLSFFKNLKKNYIIFLVPLFLLIITSFTSINPEAYNINDDYQKYFVHPIKMLETGSLYGSKIGAIGLQILGGQAFFQAFFVSWLGIKSINIFDSVFCFIVCSIIIFEYSIQKKSIFLGCLLVCLFILIHPQYVNTSSIYSACLFMMSSMILSLNLLNENQTFNRLNLKICFVLSLFFASLPILKSTYAIFPIIYFLLFIIVFIFIKNLNKYKIFVCIGIPFFSFIFFVPWTLFLIDLYSEILLTSNQTLNVNLPWIKPVFRDFFSNDQLFYGSTYLNYTSLMIIVLFLVLIILFNFFIPKKINFEKKYFFPSLIYILTGFIIITLIIFFGSKIHHHTTLIRYSIPFMLATVPLSIISSYIIIQNSNTVLKLIVSMIVIILCLAQIPQYIKQINSSYKCGSKLSFAVACNNEYIKYNEFVLEGKRKLLTQNWQENIPKGEKIMAWMNTPFFLDFKRNDIHEITIGGFNNPWTKFPSAKFLIFEHSGVATRSKDELVYSANNDYLLDRKTSIRTIQHIIKINHLIKTGKAKVIRRDSSILILEIE